MYFADAALPDSILGQRSLILAHGAHNESNPEVYCWGGISGSSETQLPRFGATPTPHSVMDN
jgi:hypothetical protein